MSSVRMCDSCGNIFSERAAGWSTGTVSRVDRDEKGRPTAVTETLDQGPCCSGATVITPRLSLTAGQADRIADTQTQADRDATLGGM